MDVLAPDLMWIDGRCYRIPTLDSAFSTSDIVTFKDCDLEEEADDMIICEEEYVTDIPDVEVMQNGRFRMVYPVSRAFLPFIIGSKGATIKRISKDTSCNIMTPRFSEEQNITITGQTKNKVILAWKSIEFVIKSNRSKLAITHFVSIPLTGKEIQENFKKFKEEVLSTCNDRGISEDVFQVAEKLHLTVVVLILTDDKERKIAEDRLLQVCNDSIRSMLVGNKPCMLEVRGLDYFNDDPSEVNVLYGNVKIKGNDDLLQNICNKISDAFKDLGLMKDEDSNAVRLHLTLMNTSFLFKTASDSEKNQKFKTRRNETFDASNIFRKFKDFYFGEQELKCVHLSTRFTTDNDGFYKHAAMVEL